MALDVNAIMDALGVRLATIAGLRVSDHVPKTVAVPAAIVGFPEEGTYDETYGGAADSTVIPVTVLVGSVTDRAARVEVNAYTARAGAKSIKAAVDGNLGGVVHDARVAKWKIEEITYNAAGYLGATFRVEVWA
jgi:hypothetical protein